MSPAPLHRPLDRRNVRRDRNERIRVLEDTRRIWPVHDLHARPMAALASGIAIGVTSATFTDVWQAQCPHIYAPTLNFGVFLYIFSGYSAEVRCQITDDEGTSTTGAVASVTAGSDDFYGVNCQWLHGREVYQGFATVTIQVRRTAGSPDPIYVYQPTQFSLRDPDNATTAPVWTYS